MEKLLKISNDVTDRDTVQSISLLEMGHLKRI